MTTKNHTFIFITYKKGLKIVKLFFVRPEYFSNLIGRYFFLCFMGLKRQVERKATPIPLSMIAKSDINLYVVLTFSTKHPKHNSHSPVPIFEMWF